MAQHKKEGASKRTFRLYDDVFTGLEKIARTENRTVTAQLEVFLREMIKQYERSQSEKSPGNSMELHSVA